MHKTWLVLYRGSPRDFGWRRLENAPYLYGALCPCAGDHKILATPQVETAPLGISKRKAWPFCLARTDYLNLASSGERIALRRMFYGRTRHGPTAQTLWYVVFSIVLYFPRTCAASGRVAQN